MWWTCVMSMCDEHGNGTTHGYELYYTRCIIGRGHDMAKITWRLSMFIFCPSDVSLVFPSVTCENVTHRKFQKGDYRDGLLRDKHTHTQADHPIHPN